MDLKHAIAVLTHDEAHRFLGDGDAKFFNLGNGQAIPVKNRDELAPEWEQYLIDNKIEIIVGCWSMPELSPAAIQCMSSLRYVCLLTGSVKPMVPREFLSKGGFVSNWNNLAAPSVAECALLLILGCLRRVQAYSELIHSVKGWRDNSIAPPQGLFGRRIGIHGFGAVARSLIQLLSPFGVTIQSWSEPVQKSVFEKYGVAKADSLMALFRDNEIIVEVEGLTPKTCGIVNKQYFEHMCHGGVFVNVGRGGVVVENDLLDAIESRNLYVGLDVYQQEPLPVDSKLRGHRNALLLPHTAGPTLDRYCHIVDWARKNILNYISTGKPCAPLSVEQYDNAT